MVRSPGLKRAFLQTDQGRSDCGMDLRAAATSEKQIVSVSNLRVLDGLDNGQMDCQHCWDFNTASSRVTTKNGLTYLFRRLNQFWQANGGGLHATFLVQRDMPDGGLHIAVLSANELFGMFFHLLATQSNKDNETADVYSVQESPIIDYSLIMAVNRRIILPPRIIMPDLGGVEMETQQISDVAPEVSSVQSLDISSKMVSPTKTIPTKGTSKSLGRMKTLPLPPRKKNKATAPTTRQTVIDLKTTLKSDLFSVDDEHENIYQVPTDRDMHDKPEFQAARSSFVVFSSEEDEDKVEDNHAPASSPNIEVEAFESTMESFSPMTPSQTTVEGHVKMIKVPRTFMEGGYLMTEYVTEMVPDDSPERPPQVAREEEKPKISAKIMDHRTKGYSKDGMKQGSLLAFFKQK